MPPSKDARSKLLDAAMAVIRGKGFSATSVDEICQAAGVTKGAFFHHFRSKEDLGVAAAAHFGDMAATLFAAAPYQSLDDPLQRLLGYVDFRREILQGELPEFTCLLGTMVQEAYATHPAIREACEREIVGHASTLEADIAAAMSARGRAADWTPRSLALHVQAVLQGAFILAKATGGAQVAADNLGHLRRYLTLLFMTDSEKGGSLMSYVDGLVVAVPTENHEAYRRYAEEALPVFKDHGALRHVECWGDDVPEGKVTSFRMAVKASPDETVVFSWLEWPSKEVRDAGMAKAMADPRMPQNMSSAPFDGKRTIYGGFTPIVDS